MEQTIQRIAEWLETELAAMPAEMTAVYIEYGTAFQGTTKFIYVDVYGFKKLADGKFDPANKEHWKLLGDFDWESKKSCEFKTTEFPGIVAIQRAAKAPKVRALIKRRGLLVLAAEHDGDVMKISEASSPAPSR